MFEQLATYITEDLSQEGKTLLAFLRRTGKLTDDMVKDLATKAGVNPDGDEYKSWVIDEDELDEYINSHGLGEDVLVGRNMTEIILKNFSKNKKTDVLKNIIQENGTCSFKDFEKGNNILNFCNGWEEVAKVLAKDESHKSLKRSTVGKYELLMRFIFKESVPPITGDVVVNIGGKNISIEVKNTGARIKGQGDMGSYDEATKIILNGLMGSRLSTNQALDQEIMAIPNIKMVFKKKYGGFFRNQTFSLCLGNLMNVLDDSHNDKFAVNETPFDEESNIYYILARAICCLYNEHNKVSMDVNRLADAFYKLNENNPFITFDKTNGYTIKKAQMINAWGAAQLCGYWSQETFNYICVFDEKTDNYCLVTEDTFKNYDLISIANKFNFTGNDGENSREGACRISLKKG